VGPHSILQRRWFLLCTCAAPLALAACGPKPPPPPLVDLLVETDGDLLAFSPKELTCHAGDHVRLTFRHTGKYVNSEHNWVLILPHTFEGVTAAAQEAGPEHGWLPHADRRILAATPLCGRGSVVTTEFVAPKAGDYPFICTYPGHGQSMWGVLHVLPRSRT
jgi:azurin